MSVVQERHVTVLLRPVTCYKCGVLFGMASDYQDDRRRKGDTWYCPNGHPQIYAETTEQRLRRELDATNRRLDAQRQLATYWRGEEERERRQRIALKGQLTKARRRAAHGVCPVPDCRRTFQNLAHHMAREHARYRAEADAAFQAGPEDQPKTSERIAETVDGPYGSMRKTLKQGGEGYRPAVYYTCACGWEGGTARGAAATHARTCAKARQPWPTG